MGLWTKRVSAPSLIKASQLTISFAPTRDSCILAYCLPHTYSKEIPTLCWSSVPYQRSERARKLDGNSIILVINCVWLGPCGKWGRDWTNVSYCMPLCDESLFICCSVSEPLSTSFGQHDSSRPEKLISDFSAGYGGYTSFVQYRGSIPVMWHQESNQMTPRPPIESRLIFSTYVTQAGLIDYQSRSKTPFTHLLPSILTTYWADMVPLYTFWILLSPENLFRVKANCFLSTDSVSNIWINSCQKERRWNISLGICHRLLRGKFQKCVREDAKMSSAVDNKMS